MAESATQAPRGDGESIDERGEVKTLPKPKPDFRTTGTAGTTPNKEIVTRKVGT